MRGAPNYGYRCAVCNLACERHVGRGEQFPSACSRACARRAGGRRCRNCQLPGHYVSSCPERPDLWFWPNVIRGDGCWEWAPKPQMHGYGRISRVRGNLYAHRASYEINVGPIPPGMLVCHRCDNRRCVRPDHLFLGDDRSNARDRDAKGRHRYVLPPSATPEQRARGSAHGNAKLSEVLVRQIKSRIAAGEPQVSIARDLGVAKTTVNGIKMGKAWKHVEVGQ